MNRYFFGRTSAVSLALTALLLIPTLATAQMTPAPSPTDKPMGDDQMGSGMNMPGKMPAKKRGCCGMSGMGGMGGKHATMPMKHARPHHRAKAKPAPSTSMAKPMSDDM